MNHTNLFSRRTAGFIAAFAAFASLSATAQVVIQPLTEATSKETKIYASVPTSNFSSNLNISSADIGAHFLALVQFDLSQLGAVNANDITSAFVTLYVTGLGPTGGNPMTAIGGDVTLSEILNPWTEVAPPMGDPPPVPPLATYDAFFGADPTMAFGAAVATQNVTGAGFYNWDVTDTVKSWMNNPATNHGFFIQLASIGGDIGIADVDSHPGISGSSPKLTVVPEPGSALLLGSAALALGCIRRRRTD